MWRVVRSELVRLRRRTFVLGWLGLTALSSVVLTSFAYLATEEAPEVAEAAPGGGFPSAEARKIDVAIWRSVMYASRSITSWILRISSFTAPVPLASTSSGNARSERSVPWDPDIGEFCAAWKDRPL